MHPVRLRRMINLWPPFLFTGIRVLDIGADWRSARVRLRKRWYNSNYVGVHFGGSLFAMTDPFWMILVKECLGRNTSCGTKLPKSNSWPPVALTCSPSSASMMPRLMSFAAKPSPDKNACAGSRLT